MPMYTGQILATENAQILKDVGVSNTVLMQSSECSKQSSGKYGKIQDGLESSIRYKMQSNFFAQMLSSFNLTSSLD